MCQRLLSTCGNSPFPSTLATICSCIHIWIDIYLKKKYFLTKRNSHETKESDKTFQCNLQIYLSDIWCSLLHFQRLFNLFDVSLDCELTKKPTSHGAWWPFLHCMWYDYNYNYIYIIIRGYEAGRNLRYVEIWEPCWTTLAIGLEPISRNLRQWWN